MAKTKQRILVTGGAGFIGSSFVAQAVAKGIEVIIYDALTYAGHRENIEWIPDQHKLKLVVGDICNGELVTSVIREQQVDAVFNFAAESHVDNSISRPSIFIETNIVGTYKLLQASLEYWRTLEGDKKKNFRYIQVSTDEVYGSLGTTGKFSETTPMQPNSPYSASKAAGDHLVRAWYETYDLPAICTNCSNNYGPRQYPEKLIPTIITKALSNQPIPIYGDGKNIRDWIHVEDHCEGVYLAYLKGKPGQTYCFGGNAERTNIQTVNTVCDILDELQPRKDKKSYRQQIKFVADRAGHDRRYAINDAKAKKALGFKRKYNFEKGIEETVKWYVNNQTWCRAVMENNKRRKIA